MRSSVSLCGFVVLCCLSPPAARAQASDPNFQPYVIDHFAFPETAPTDLTHLLDAPAGKHGFIRVVDSHLAHDKGRIRFWGVNITGWVKGSALLPPKEDAALWATQLGRLGINCVRFHFLDRTTRQIPRGLIDGNRSDSRHFDAEQLDRLDYFIYELKQRGIYSDLNLNVGRDYKPGDEVPDSQLIQQAKAMTYIGPRLLELQREYARMLLTHYNPYTRSEYRHEPAIAIVEIVNENSVTEFWSRNWLRGELKPGSPRLQLDFTPYYEKILTDRYNEWLKKRYPVPADLARFRKLAGAKPGEPVRRLRREEFADAPQERFYAEAEFYTDVEATFFREMKSYLKDTLGVKSLITGTADHTYFIPPQPLVRTTSSVMDIVDAHVYWQHPAIFGRRNLPMVNDPLHSTIVKLTRSSVAGKPHVITEVNHPQPSEYMSEMIPILAAYGAFHDWDGIFFYTFEPKLRGQWQALLADPFDITVDPVRVAQLPVGALLFLRDLKPARQTVERRYSAAQVHESNRLPDSEMPYYAPGFPLSIPLRHGSRIRCFHCVPGPLPKDDPAGPYIADTRELAWHTSPEKGGVVTIDTGRSQALVGFVRGNDAVARTRHLTAEVRNDFCALTVSSLDGKPIGRSARLLLTATAREQNTGSQWNERRTLWETLGQPPTLIEPVTGWLLLRDIEGAVGMKVTALDGSARPLAKPVRARRLEAGWEIPLGDPATTSYLIEPLR